MNLREKLLGKTNVRYATVKDPDGDEWTLRSLTEGERSKQELAGMNLKTGQPAYAKLPENKRRFLALCLVDPETKEQLLQGEDWRQLENVDGSVIASIYSAALRLNGYEKEEIEELVGNSD